MSNFVKRPRDGKLYLLWNHSTRFVRVPDSPRPLEPTQAVVSQRHLPRGQEGNARLIPTSHPLWPKFREMVAAGHLKAAEMCTDAVVRIPLDPRKFPLKVYSAEQARADMEPAAPVSHVTPAATEEHPSLADIPLTEEAAPVEEATAPAQGEEAAEVEPLLILEAPVDEGAEEGAPADEPEEEEAEDLTPPTRDEADSGGEVTRDVADMALYESIPWDTLDDLNRTELRELGKAFDPPITGMSKAGIVDDLRAAREALGG